MCLQTQYMFLSTCMDFSKLILIHKLIYIIYTYIISIQYSRRTVAWIAFLGYDMVSDVTRACVTPHSEHMLSRDFHAEMEC